jgi:2-oxo-3-hexenedioate decarboxylase/2-keto-4-pentenoate hydratase
MAKPKASELPERKAAARLLEAHERRERFAPLPPELAPKTEEQAYAIQDAFLALRADKLGSIAGYKIALSSAEMQRFVGVKAPQAGAILRSQVRRSPARIRASDYLHLIVEFEIGVEMGDDLPAADAPFTRERVLLAVGAVMPAIEIADDRNADYSQLSRHPYELIADNCWNEGAVLGEPQRDWKALDLGQVLGVATINGRKVGEGQGEGAMGHPLDAVAWIANHLASQGRGLLRGEFVITGSLITTKTVKAGDRVEFALGGVGKTLLSVD